jgi:soluble cytochrome b562
LNAGAVGDSSIGGIEPTDSNVGKDLNDNGADAVLDNFQEDKWSDLSLEEQKQSMTDLADFVAADTGNENPPEIVFRDDMPDGSYGGYSPETNTMEININMLDDSAEAADTIAHEMWHAHQEQAAKDPSNPRAQEYQDGFDNYISPEYDFEGYQNQMVEAEARDYAQGFKDRLASMKGAA